MIDNYLYSYYFSDKYHCDQCAELKLKEMFYEDQFKFHCCDVKSYEEDIKQYFTRELF